MPSDKTPAAETSPPTRRVIAVLELLAEETPRTSAQIADRLGLSRSTVGNVLTELQGHEWVTRRADLSYELGPALWRTADRGTHHRDDPDPRHSALRRLAREVDCGAALLEVHGAEVRFAIVVENRGRIPAGISIGTHLPLIPPAAATIIAHSDQSSRERWLAAADLEHRTEYETLLADIRVMGAAVWGVDAHSLTTLDVLADVVEHLDHTPNSHILRERVLALLGGISGHPYRPADLDDDTALPISYISAAVLHEHGEPTAELLIGPLRSAVTREERDHYLGALTDSARSIPSRTGTRWPPRSGRTDAPTISSSGA
ncbi:helix-turn-helix domain-containing protein [Nocardia neocaledoniensis]|uniref:DNA-binding IclR family transcriptional regulator n=1 Tax=Nocardia neocaledoniensis TaxID=236511 RepID=A0A317N6Z9_9NOCA|nr:helix-turn-helix domain-containing protein [Nocardia neocaledoniensis]PWV71051.1 DNA-binding IclR family transcriptional regulator [Nocardia neocaledoniensis]